MTIWCNEIGLSFFRSQDKTLGEVQERLGEIREKAENALVAGNRPDEEKEKITS